MASSSPMKWTSFMSRIAYILEEEHLIYSNTSPSIVSAKGQLTELDKLLTPKAYFAIALWKEKGALYCLGGFNVSNLK